MDKRSMGTLPLQRTVLCSMIFARLILCTAQRVPGFLSIDCGSGISAPYNDSITELTWDNDQNYTTAGKDGLAPPGIIPPHSTGLKTFRYFPEVRKRYCYELPSTRSFLIRATFLAIDLCLPVKFHLAINATVWQTITRTLDNSWNPILVAEGIFFSPGGTINFCLIPETGIPFISSLEVRELDADGKMYSFYEREEMYLTSIWRTTFADPGGKYDREGKYDSEIIRYPNDAYDRLWSANTVREAYESASFYYISNASLHTRNTSADVNYVPSSIMSTAIVLKNDSFGQLTPSFDYFSANPQYTYTYWIFYFQDLRSYSIKTSSNIIIRLNGGDILAANISTNSMTKTTYPNFPLGDHGDGNETFLINVQNERHFIDGTFLNAAEAYEQQFFNFSKVVAQDDKIIKFLRQAYNLSHWEGDPCFPFPFEELECSTWQTYLHGDLDGDVPVSVHVISSIYLSNLPRPVFNASEDTFTFRQIQILSLPSTHIDDEFSDIIWKSLNYLGPPVAILLDLSYNNMTRIPSSWPRFKPWFLNLSSNSIQGDISALSLGSTINNMKELNLSRNRITSLPSSWGAAVNWPATFYPALSNVDISHNLVSEELSSISGVMKACNSSLSELYISNNNFSGTIDSGLYFSTMQRLKIAILDHNHIGGVLDLTPWITSWQRQSKIPGNASWIGITFSLINNDVQDISPSAKVLDTNIYFFLNHLPDFNKSGILLGGNPYCENSKDGGTLTHKYLCRYSLDEEIKVSKKKDILPLILPTSLGGALLIMIILSSFFFVVWRLRKRILELQRVQDEFLRRNVQPPFFSYASIKIATRNFHKENKIGQGGFGVVYEGILDGRKIAVKKLTNITTATQDSSVLSDFLNEVVLITGIKHKNLIQLRGCCIKDEERMLIYDFADNGNLDQALHVRNTLLDLNTRISVCFGIARGLTYLHDELQPRIVHRDIKPANILLDQNFNPKIADFGLARFVKEESTLKMTMKAGTWGYLAPEYELSDKMDVFSFGILVLEIMSGRKSIDYKLPTERSDLRIWARKLSENNSLLDLLPDHLRMNCEPDQITSLLKVAVNCTHLDPEHRPSMFHVLATLTRIFIEQTDITESEVHQEMLVFENSAESGRRVTRRRQSLATMTEMEGEDEFPLVHSSGTSTAGTSTLNPSCWSSFEMEGRPQVSSDHERTSTTPDGHARSACRTVVSF